MMSAAGDLHASWVVTVFVFDSVVGFLCTEVIDDVGSCLGCSASVLWDALCETCLLAGGLTVLQRYLGDDRTLVGDCYPFLPSCLFASFRVHERFHSMISYFFYSSALACGGHVVPRTADDVPRGAGTWKHHRLAGLALLD